MSRSYKHTPYSGDNKGKDKKRCANSKVRMYLKDFNNEISHKNFKHIYESYDICDFYWMETWEEYWHNRLIEYKEHPNWFKHPPIKKEEYRKWYKLYKMK